MQGDGEEGTEGVPAFTAAAGSDSADHGEERGTRESPGFEDTAPPTSIGGSSSVPRISSDTMHEHMMPPLALWSSNFTSPQS